MRNALSAVAVLFVITLGVGCSSSSSGSSDQGPSGSVEGSRFTFVWPEGYSYDSPSNALTGPSAKLQSSAPAYVTGATVTFSQPGMTPITLDIPLSTGVVNFVLATGTYTIDVVVTTSIGLTFTATQTADLLPGLNDLTFNMNVNAPPTITSLTASSTSPTVGETIKLTCSATDLDPDDTLTYSWSGAATGSGASISYHVGGAGSATFTCQVTDGHGGTDTGSVKVNSNAPAPAPVAPACVGDFTVNATGDTPDAAPNDGICADAVGNCTLRSAIDETNAMPGVQTICLPAGTYTNTIASTDEDGNVDGDLDITDDLTITGAGAGTTIIDGGGAGIGDRVLHIPGATTVNISGVTIQNGKGTVNYGGGIKNIGTVTVTNSTISGNSATWGGGIYNNYLGTVTVTNSTISNNGAVNDGGGIYNDGTANITNSTISGNTVNSGDGGGIWNEYKTLAVTNSTITDNSATTGGGIYNFAGTVNLKNTIVANQAGGGDCNANVTSTLNDLDSDASCLGAAGTPITLGPLQSNGGPTKTHALQAGSPAINAGNTGACPTTDQRGYNRPDACDIGAYEFNGFP